MKLVTAVGGAHHAAGEFELWRAGGAYHHELEAIVDDGWVAGAAARPLVELEHRLMAAWVKKLGDAALPLGKFPLNGSYTLQRSCCDYYAVASIDGHLRCQVLDWQQVGGSGVEQMGIPLLDVSEQQSVEVDAVVSLHRAVAPRCF